MAPKHSLIFQQVVAMNSQLTQFRQSIQTQVDNEFSRYLNSLPEQAPKLKEAMTYALLGGGKRVRPLITKLVGQMLDANESDLLICGLAIEAIHTFSLVHDDLPAMDDDDLRRGKATCHKAFDEATAILVGDALQAMAFELLSQSTFSQSAKARQLDMIRVLSSATGYQGLCAGQSIDIEATGKQINLSQLETLHQFKTGKLIQAAVQLGYYCANLQDEKTIELLDTYSQNIGLAFQVIDDILDVTSDTNTLGKPQGSDEALGKSTYPTLLGIQGAKDFADQLAKNALQALDALPYNTQLLNDFTHFVLDRNY